MPTFTELQTPLRHESDLTQIAGRVQDIVNSRLDIVAPQSSLNMGKVMEHAEVSVPEPMLLNSGVVTELTGAFTRTALQQVADRLRIPLSYVDRLMDMEQMGGRLLAAHSIRQLAEMDGRHALYRWLNTSEGLVLRAVLSDRFQLIDHDAALQALMQGMAGNDLALDDCEVEGDVTMDRLRLRIAIPAIEVHAPDLLTYYRSPFDSRPGSELPVVWAGIEVANSETGHGAYALNPRLVVQKCRNGMVGSVNYRRAHVGASLESGTINWSDETRDNALSLITSQTTDAVREFTSTGFVEREVNRMREANGHVVESPSEAIEVTQDRFGLTEAESRSVLDMFARGGLSTVFGVAQAMTAAAQTCEDGDRQAEIEQFAAQVIERPALVA